MKTKQIFYGILFCFPRAFLELISSLLTIITFGQYLPPITFWKINKHSKWALKIAEKISEYINSEIYMR